MQRFFVCMLILFASTNFCAAYMQPQSLQSQSLNMPSQYGALPSLNKPSSGAFKLGVEEGEMTYEPSDIGILGLRYLQRPGEMSTVVEVYPHTPAEDAGIVVGDKIVEVDGTNIMPFNADEVFGLIAGRPGTMVNLKMMRCGNGMNGKPWCRTFSATLKRMDMNQLKSDQIYKIYRYTN